MRANVSNARLHKSIIQLKIVANFTVVPISLENLAEKEREKFNEKKRRKL